MCKRKRIGGWSLHCKKEEKEGPYKKRAWRFTWVGKGGGNRKSMKHEQGYTSFRAEKTVVRPNCTEAIYVQIMAGLFQPPLPCHAMPCQTVVSVQLRNMQRLLILNKCANTHTPLTTVCPIQPVAKGTGVIRPRRQRGTRGAVHDMQGRLG